MNRTRKRKINTALARSIRLGIDVPLLLITITLLVVGVLMVYSASWDVKVQENATSSTVVMQQLRSIMIAGIGAIFLTFFDYRLWKKFALPAMIVIIALLIGVLLFGEEVFGAKRSLIGKSVQPSEFAKFVLIIYLAVWLDAKRERLNEFTFWFIPLSIILGVLMVLIFAQPDRSAAITLLLIGGMMFFLAGGSWKQVSVMVIVAIAIAAVFFLLNPTDIVRIEEYTQGLENPMEASYHAQRSMDAFALGGWFGVGFGQGTTKYYSLPTPHNDSIFAVIAEETGVLGSGFVLILFLLFMWRGIVISRKSADSLGGLMAAGFSFWIALEALINILGLLELLPIAGNALPFFSAGGSIMLAVMASVGVLMSISRHGERERDKARRSIDEVVDLRRGDRGRSVSRSRRSRRIVR